MTPNAPLPSEVITRKEAAAIIGVSRKRVTNMRSAGELTPANVPGRKAGLFRRNEVEALAIAREAQREARQLEVERRRAEPAPRPVPTPPPDQEATFEELMLAAE